MKDIALVVPTNRVRCINDFISRWDNIGLFDVVDLIVVEDNPTHTFTLDDKFEHRHLSWSTIKEELQEKEWIIPRRSDTVRSYGYYWAYKCGYQFIMTLDDDCYPCKKEDGIEYDGAAFVNEHLKNLNNKTKWFNTLNSVKPRGIPYFNLGINDRIVLNHGLWTNVLDYDAPFQLANPAKENFSFDNTVVPSNVYFPMCGMNVMWKREVTPLMYHLLMGKRVNTSDGDIGQTDKDGLNKLQFDRFGDIWCGIIMKKIVDHMGRNVSTGMPYIHHERASNPFANIKKEANGLEVNEGFWQHIDAYEFSLICDRHDVAESSYAKCYVEMGEHVKTYKEFPEYNEYFEMLGNAMVEWGHLFFEEIV